MINFTTAYAALYNRAATDSAGAGVRALVGSIFEAQGLKNLTGKTLPYLVWGYLPVDGGSEQMVNVNGGWYAYTVPTDTPATLTTIASAVYALYRGEGRFDIAGGKLHVLAPRAPFLDQALNLRGIHIPVYWRTLG